MEHTLETLVDVERRELALDEEAQHAREAAAVAEPAAAGEYAAGAGGPGIPTATLTVGEKGANGGGATLAPPSEQQSLVLTELTDNELQHRIARLERARGRAQLVLLRRYVRAERELLAAGVHEREPSSGGERRREPHKRRETREPRVTRKDQASTEAVRHLQDAMNRFTRKYLANITPLIEDGKKGPATNKRIRHVKYWLGYSNKERRTASIDPRFLRRMLHPRSPGASSPAMVARGIARRRRQHKLATASAQSRAGVTTFDDKPVAAWMVPYLDWARAHGWQGHLNSGYRTPEYSEHLCMGMCGAVRCPGKCAGRTSNHSQRTSPRGALDVTDYVHFGELMKRCPHSPPIFNNLPADRLHFSSTGG
jgi:hypothetical protein